MSDRPMRDNDIPESNCSHGSEIRQIPKTQLPKPRIETGILHTTVLEHDQSSLIENRKDEVLLPRLDAAPVITEVM